MAKSKIFNLLLAAVLACILWVYVVTVERTDMEWDFYNIPVVMDGESVLEGRGLKITSDTELTVSLRLYGNRSDLNKLRSSDITVMVDLTRIYEAGKKQLSYEVSFPGNSTIEVVKRNPDTINLTVVEWVEKEIPIKEKLTGTTPNNYVIDRQNVTLEHDSITVAGPKDVVDQIAMGQVKVEMSGRTDAVEGLFPITLCDGNGKPVEDVSAVTVSVGQIRVEVPVLMVKDVTLELPVVNGGGLMASDVTVTIDGVDISKESYVITVSGAPADVKKLGDSIQLGILDLSKETESFQNREYTIDLPEGIRNVSTGLDTVQVSMTLPMMRSINFQVPMEQFEILEPANYTVKCRTVSMTVYVRGRETILEKVKLENIRVVVDLTDATENGYYPAEVTVEGVENVGVIPNPKPNAEYEVWIVVEPKAPAGG